MKHYIKRLKKTPLKSSLSSSLMMTVLGFSSSFFTTGLLTSTPAYADSTSIGNSTKTKTYQIQGFSEEYRATVTPMKSTTDDEEDNVIIKLIDRRTGNSLISQPAYIDIEYELDNGKEHNLNGKISANIVNMPYGEHSILIYEDMNFDGIKDIAINDGKNGCYGGKSYQVYLANKNGKGFRHSQEFSDLTEGYCGFFGIDEEKKTLHTMTKSGAAWHEYRDYKVINNKPVVIKIYEEDYNNSRGLIGITESKRVKGKMVTEYYELLMDYDALDVSKEETVSYAFELENGKQLLLDSTYNSNGDEILYYAFADKNDKVELYYNKAFHYNPKTKTLSFTNKPVTYRINKQGITVKLPNKTILLKAKANSQIGDLDKVKKFKNVATR